MIRHAAVIVTYNRAEKLRICLSHIESQTLPFDRVVVVDNASSDETTEILLPFRQKEKYVILREEKNLGGAGGFAEGIRLAYDTEAEWITVLDDDAFLEPDFLAVIDEQIRSDGGKFLCYAGVPLTNGIRPGHRRRVSGKLVKRERAVLLKEYEQDVFLCDIASFCGLVLHRFLVKQAGYPEAGYFLWYDDTEYCLRFSRDYPIVNVNRARIDHRAEASGTGGWREYYNIRNRIHMSRKHYGFLTAAVLTIWKETGAAVSSAKLLLRGQGGKGLEELRLCHTAVRDAWRGRLGLSERYRPGKK